MADDAPAAARPNAPRFRRRNAGPRPSPDQARRQAEVANLAWRMLDGRDEIVAFLNTHDDRLGGRPIDLAIASDAGLAAVETEMRERAADQGRRMLKGAQIG